MTLGIVCLVATGFTWVAIGIIINSAARQGRNLAAIQFLAALICVAVSLAVLAGTGEPLLLSPVVPFMLAAGIGNYATFQMMGRAMRSGPGGIVWGLIQSALIFPFLMGMGFFGVSCTGKRAAGVLLILLSIAFFAKCRNASRDGRNSGWFGWTLGAFLLAGFTQCMTNLPSYFPFGEASNVLKTMWVQIGTVLAFLVEAWFRPQLRRTGKIWRPVLLLALATLVPQYFFFYRGLNAVAAHGAGSIGYPVALGSCIIGFYLYSVTVLKERMTPLSAAAGCCGIAGIVLLC